MADPHTEGQAAADAIATLDDTSPDGLYRGTQGFSDRALAVGLTSLGGGGGGGGTGSARCVRFPIAFDTPGLNPQSFPITAVDLGVYPITAVVVGDGGDGSFTVAGDHTAAFPVDGTFSVTGSTGNDNTYTVESASFAAGHTTVEVPEFFYDATPDGSLVVASTFTIAGQHTDEFAAGVGFVITGSTGNNSSFTVATVGMDGPDTVITPVSPLNDPTADGNAVVSVGVPIYTPAVGDMLYGNAGTPLIHASIATAWDGDAPKLRVGNQADRQNQAFLSGFDADTADGDFGNGMFTSPNSVALTATMLWRFTTTDPLLAWVESGSGGLDPGSTQGAGEIVFMVLPAGA